MHILPAWVPCLLPVLPGQVDEQRYSPHLLQEKILLLGFPHEGHFFIIVTFDCVEREVGVAARLKNKPMIHLLIVNKTLKHYATRIVSQPVIFQVVKSFFLR